MLTKEQILEKMTSVDAYGKLILEIVPEDDEVRVTLFEIYIQYLVKPDKFTQEIRETLADYLVSNQEYHKALANIMAILNNNDNKHNLNC